MNSSVPYTPSEFVLTSFLTQNKLRNSSTLTRTPCSSTPIPNWNLSTRREEGGGRERAGAVREAPVHAHELRIQLLQRQQRHRGEGQTVHGARDGLQHGDGPAVTRGVVVGGGAGREVRRALDGREQRAGEHLEDGVEGQREAHHSALRAFLDDLGDGDEKQQRHDTGGDAGRAGQRDVDDRASVQRGDNQRGQDDLRHDGHRRRDWEEPLPEHIAQPPPPHQHGEDHHQVVQAVAQQRRGIVRRVGPLPQCPCHQWEAEIEEEGETRHNDEDPPHSLLLGELPVALALASQTLLLVCWRLVEASDHHEDGQDGERHQCQQNQGDLVLHDEVLDQVHQQPGRDLSCCSHYQVVCLEHASPLQRLSLGQRHDRRVGRAEVEHGAKAHAAHQQHHNVAEAAADSGTDLVGKQAAQAYGRQAQQTQQQAQHHVRLAARAPDGHRVGVEPHEEGHGGGHLHEAVHGFHLRLRKPQRAADHKQQPVAHADVDEGGRECGGHEPHELEREEADATAGAQSAVHVVVVEVRARHEAAHARGPGVA
ncbi:unnamed protein product [Phytophthora fragariaefolia]|uniref:Unnamed protein product n=1 Tax=Phytophthora fragariaefolia TaxID=1490495 RepID=A0A9W7CXK2_9STRA|nr:unnamed protein product [Phytophthora fragariaefolia]